MLLSLFKLKPPIEIYTDGSHKGRWGAWAFVVVADQKIIYEESGSVRKTNSHRMEFQAALQALQYLPVNVRAVINTDSKVLLDCFTKQRRRSSGNEDQVEAIDKLLLQRQITWRWVKAHHGNIYNERCDQLCLIAREG